MRRRLVAVLLVVVVLGPLAFGESYPAVSESRRIEMLRPPGKKPVRMVLDTDTYNEMKSTISLRWSMP